MKCHLFMIHFLLQVIQHIFSSLNLLFPIVLMSNTQMPGLINQNHLLNYLLLWFFIHSCLWLTELYAVIKTVSKFITCVTLLVPVLYFYIHTFISYWQIDSAEERLSHDQSRRKFFWSGFGLMSRPLYWSQITNLLQCQLCYRVPRRCMFECSHACILDCADGQWWRDGSIWVCECLCMLSCMHTTRH